MSDVTLPLVCPDCASDLDASTYVVWWCAVHKPTRDGVDDAAVVSHGYSSGDGEAGGEANRLWNALLMRGRKV